ncbi:hypothetical protein N7G274_010630 [Stereocaulon virgatum]|uniref:Peptidase A1 domain-containing protein n=1 Tax=Stereocaulon virgatum TaxID=373712 RepID=A0ABR3ZVP9_9LECA
MISQSMLDRNIFSTRLARNDKEKGELVLGSIDKEFYTGEPVELPATNVTCGENEAIAFYSSSGWQIPVQSISLSSNASSGPFHAALPNYTAIISTDYPYIALPRGLAPQFAEHCGASPDWSALSCAEGTLLPNLTIILGPDRREIVLTPWDYMFEVEDETYGTRCLLPFETLMEWLDGFDYIVSGTAFLSGLYSVFDYDNQTISREYGLIFDSNFHIYTLANYANHVSGQGEMGAVA